MPNLEGRSYKLMRDREVPPRKRRAVLARARQGTGVDPAPANGIAATAHPYPQHRPQPDDDNVHRIAPATNTSNSPQCLHCGTKTTPLWRKGPAGPSTLCNACGTRWKRHGSVALRRPIATSTPEAIAASASASVSGNASNSRNHRPEQHDEYIPENSSSRAQTSAAPSSSRRSRYRVRRTLCPECGGQITQQPDGTEVCEICVALNEAEEEEHEPYAEAEAHRNHYVQPQLQPQYQPQPELQPQDQHQMQLEPKQEEKLVRPQPNHQHRQSQRRQRPLVNEFTGEPVVLEPALVAAYSQPPEPVPWVAPKDGDDADDSDDVDAALVDAHDAVMESQDEPEPEPMQTQYDAPHGQRQTCAAKRTTSKRVYVEFEDDEDEEEDVFEEDEDEYEHGRVNGNTGATRILKCFSCGTTTTPLWRKGPAGPNTLCNACGTRWKRHGSVALDRSAPIARKRKPAVPRAALNHHANAVLAPRSPSPVQRVAIQRPPSPDYGPVVPMDPQEAARDIPYLPALHEVLPGGVEAIIKEPVIKRSARLRKRTSRAQHFFDSLNVANTNTNANSNANNNNDSDTDDNKAIPPPANNNSVTAKATADATANDTPRANQSAGCDRLNQGKGQIINQLANN